MLFHTLHQSDILFQVLIFFVPFHSSSIVSSVGRANHSWFKAANFSHCRKLFSKFFLQNCCHHFTWYHWFRNFPVVFQPIIIQKFWWVICTGITIILALVLYFFALCYTWTALLSTNQSTESFSCILLY